MGPIVADRDEKFLIFNPAAEQIFGPGPAETTSAQWSQQFGLYYLDKTTPFPAQELRGLFARYPQARDVRWAQEEPANMGAWRSTRHRIEPLLPPDATLRLVARKAAPSPATGYYPLHVEQERRLVERALAVERPDSDPDAPASGAPSTIGRAMSVNRCRSSCGNVWRHRTAPLGSRAVTAAPDTLNVMRLQQRLASLGFPGRDGKPLVVDGIVGPQTMWAIGLFNAALTNFLQEVRLVA